MYFCAKYLIISEVRQMAAFRQNKGSDLGRGNMLAFSTRRVLALLLIAERFFFFVMCIFLLLFFFKI